MSRTLDAFIPIARFGVVPFDTFLVKSYHYRFVIYHRFQLIQPYKRSYVNN